MIEKKERKQKKEEENENTNKRADLTKLLEKQDLEFGADGGSC